MRTVIIGSNGQLGQELVNAFARYETFPLTHREIEICELESSYRILTALKPDLVINCAAYHKTDECEDFPEKAFMVNAVAVKGLATLCHDMNAVLVQISTDYVFDGKKGSPYHENDQPNPLNTYGISKLAGEFFVKNLLHRYYIVRTSSLFGVAGASGKGGNFIETMLKKARQGVVIKVVSDMYMSPTSAKDLAYKLEEMVRVQAPFGLYHLTNQGYCSWLEFAKTVFELTHLEVKLIPIYTEDLHQKARRPLFSALESKRIREAGLQEMREWQEALQDYLKEKGYI